MVLFFLSKLSPDRSRWRLCHLYGFGLSFTERYVFTSLRDFLYVELGKAILRDNAPRQCRLCGNMSRVDFNAWVEFAAGRRDTALLLLEGTSSAEEKARLIERLREELNKA